MKGGVVFTLIAAAALGGAGCAGGPEPQRRSEVVLGGLFAPDALLLAGFDADGDYRLGAAEIEAGAARAFAAADANADGSITPIEFSVWSLVALGGANAPPFRLDVDRNVDNVITREEFSAEIAARARDYDKDEDGAITRAEMLREPPRPQVLPDRPSMPPGGMDRMRRPGG